MSLEKLNLPRLREAADRNPKHKAMFTLFADRKRGRLDSRISRVVRLMREGGWKDTTEADVREWYGILNACGAGKYIAGRGGKEDRVVFDVNPVSVAAAVLNPKATAKDVEPAIKPKVRLPKLVMTDVEPQEAPVSSATALPIASADGKVTVKAAGFEFEFPRDVFQNPAEAAEIKAFLRDIAKS